MDPLTPMEEREEKKRGMMGKEQEEEGKSQGQPASMNTQQPMTEKQDNCVGICTEMEEKGKKKGMEEGEMKKEMELKVELCQSAPGLQMSIIRDTDLFGYVGIEAVLDQMRSKTMKAGFEFNIMAVGESHPWLNRERKTPIHKSEHYKLLLNTVTSRAEPFGKNI